jgi:NAD(P)-dependent dehydrogenase (short-subunit alcohol dehydrogenase family)
MPLLDVDMGDARRTFDTNFFGVLATIQAFAPLLVCFAIHPPDPRSFVLRFVSLKCSALSYKRRSH